MAPSVSPRKRKSQNMPSKVVFVKLWWVWWLLLWWAVYGGVLWRWRPHTASAEASEEEGDEEGYRGPQVSILIPARNERECLPHVLAALKKEASRVLEVIVIDDHSTDGTAEIVREWQRGVPFSLRCLRNEGAGKKAALLTGIKAAHGEVIITLDADTVPEPGALERLIRPFCRASVQMSAAYVRFWDGTAYESGGLARRFLLGFQALEMAGFLALTAGSWQRGEPITVNGAFLAYRKEAYEAVGGWGDAPHPGGDDEFLMQRLYRRYGAQALVFSGAVAQTRPALSWQTFWHQRRRWLSKQRYYLFFWTQAGLALLGLTHFLFWLIALFSLPWALAHLCVTGALQAWVIAAGLQKLRLPRFLWLWYPLAQMWYPVYVVMLGIMVWRGGFWWRGRWYKG